MGLSSDERNIPAMSPKMTRELSSLSIVECLTCELETAPLGSSGGDAAS